MSLFDPPEIRTGRLVLAPFATGDADAVREVYLDDDAVTRFVAWRPLTDAASAQRFVDREACAWRDAEDRRGWLARAADTGEAVGSLFARLHGDASAEISYVVKRALWGRGHGTEIVHALLDRARDDPALRLVWAVCDAENAASARALEKAGMVLESRLPRHGVHNVSAEPRDCLRFVATLRPDASVEG